MVGNNAIFATSATLGGHCEIGDAVYIGGLSAVHQFTRIGSYVMVGGLSGVRDDIIPYGLANGQYAVLESLNLIGMKRRKFTKQRLASVRAFYQKLFHGPGTFAERLETVGPLASEDPAIAEILGFIGKGKRPLCLPAIEK
jgi:UDP-N-acetylglucosamine acyltransferase